MGDIMGTIRNMIWSLTHRLGFNDIIDILIVAVILYELLLPLTSAHEQPSTNSRSLSARSVPLSTFTTMKHLSQS